MQVGIRVGYASLEDFEEKVRLYQRCGVEAVELGHDALGLGLPNVQGVLHHLGLSVSAIVGSIQLLSTNRAEREAGVATDLQRLEACQEIGASGMIEVPIFGANPYPDMSPIVDRWEVERDLLVAQCKHITPKAEEVGVNLLLEPLNRYETHFLNRVDQAVDIIERVGSSALKVMPDFFHMNIEEASIPDAFLLGGDRVGYVHLADSNRKQPGVGHTDFRSGFTALKEIGYDGYLVMECGFDGDLEESLRTSVEFVRAEWAAA